MSKYTNPAGSAASAVGRGPTRGNDTLGDKRAGFKAEKDSFKAASQAITDRYAERGRDNPTTHVDANDLSIRPNVNTKRGPTKGNK